ncbi:MAG: ATP-binding cassette domain-containing protein, partial [Candidatus Hodarchaeales archaeon]
MSLQVNNAISGYGKSVIVNDVSINVDQGEIVTIIGPNGSGKTTLMKTILGYLKPFSGNILF